MKAFGIILLTLTLVAAGVVGSYRLNGWAFKRYAHGWKDGYAYIKSWEEIQKQIGAIPDGIPGPNTIQRYAWALGNQYTAELTSRKLRKHRQAMLAKAREKWKQ